MDDAKRNELTRRGAEARLIELVKELAELRDFLGLTGNDDGNGTRPAARRQHQWTDEERAATSKRMTSYWKKRKASEDK